MEIILYHDRIVDNVSDEIFTSPDDYGEQAVVVLLAPISLFFVTCWLLFQLLKHLIKWTRILFTTIVFLIISLLPKRDNKESNHDT